MIQIMFETFIITRFQASQWVKFICFALGDLEKVFSKTLLTSKTKYMYAGERVTEKPELGIKKNYLMIYFAVEL